MVFGVFLFIKKQTRSFFFTTSFFLSKKERKRPKLRPKLRLKKERKTLKTNEIKKHQKHQKRAAPPTSRPQLAVTKLALNKI